MALGPRLGAVLVAAALVLVGCSDDGDDAAPDTTAAPTSTTEATTTSEASTTTEATGPSADEWAAGFCEDFGTWVDELTVISAATAAPQASPAEAKATLGELFGRAALSTTVLADQVAAEPAPAVDDGEAVRDALVDRFRVFAATARTTQAALEALDEDGATFAADADVLAVEFRAQVDAVGASFAELDAELASPELSQALLDACSL